MAAPIDFYFDFASPYGYIASQTIDELATRHGRSVNWHAIVLDANFQSLERIRIPSSVMRSDYIIRDVERTTNGQLGVRIGCVVWNAEESAMASLPGLSAAAATVFTIFCAGAP